MNNLNIKTIGELKKFLEENFDDNDKVIGVLDVNEDCIYESLDWEKTEKGNLRINISK